ncbi:TenA family transcriptional regulator [Pantoea sp. RIT-PI-b]|uniref:TenA family protein n=1 Tax=Pantoea sp. RIT-PI-b TaxID=1681195 RepID=UPI0006764272|nr:TenA family protein [Pantoea sp. RIT-PI-b]KNC05859.1 TenA family transcriptional regulator [Pantoea sp. RIT-PI-b]
MNSFTDQLLQQHPALWQAMQQHQFVLDIERNQLPETAFKRYLVFEGNFVATAINIFALAVSKAPDIRQQRWLIGVLNALVDTQIAWFEEVLARRNINPADYPHDVPGVTAFRDGMLQVAQQGSFAEIITLMFGAEWMYYHWCARVSAQPLLDDDIRRWIDMHAEEEFHQQALWLKTELDRCAQDLSEAEKNRLSLLYGQVLQWEIDFHSAAYLSAGEGR